MLKNFCITDDHEDIKNPILPVLTAIQTTGKEAHFLQYYCIFDILPGMDQYRFKDYMSFQYYKLQLINSQ